jgi:hypothetical protein
MNALIRQSGNCNHRCFGLSGLLLIFGLLQNCAHQPAPLAVSQYRYTMADQDYRIRSIRSPEKSQSYNEVIGEKFLAVDYDQDGVLDAVVLGNTPLTEAQQVYDFGLKRLSREQKLEVRNPDVAGFILDQDNLRLEIRTFRPAATAAFNQFKIIDSRQLVQTEILVFIDHNADGVLDEALKDASLTEKYQSCYAEMIQKGLAKGKLHQVNGMILVKEK